MSPIRPLLAPKDAKLINAISRGKAARLFGTAKESKILLLAAQKSYRAWEQKSSLARTLGFFARRRDKGEIDRLTAKYHGDLDTFDAFVQRARHSTAYAAMLKPVEPATIQPTTSDVKVIIVPPEVLLEPVEAIEAPPSTIPSTPAYRLTVSPVGSNVIHLFTPKPRQDPPAPPPGNRSSMKIYLPIPANELGAVEALGAQVGPKGGIFIPIGMDTTPFEPWLPFYAKAVIEPLNVDLIPATNWGGSLANLLVDSSWQAIRDPVLAKTGNKCIVCGYDRQRKSVDCHEIWEFYTPLEGDTGIQRLVGIIPLCKSCHDMFHLGRAGQDGRLEESVQRLAWVNRWTEDEVATYLDYVDRKCRGRNKFRWMLDLSVLGEATTLTLKSGTKGVKIDEEGGLSFVPIHGDGGATKFVGVAFGHKKGSKRTLEAFDYNLYQKDV
jgi:hypothetical protein